jgi:EpsI family protein
VAYYRNQDYESKLVTSQNQLVRSTNHRWNHVAGGTHELDREGSTLRFRWSLYREHAVVAGSGPAGRVLLVWQGYWIDGRWIAGDIWAKAYGAVHRLAARGDDGAAVVLYAIGQDEKMLQADLQAFVGEALPALEAALVRTREQR